MKKLALTFLILTGLGLSAGVQANDAEALAKKKNCLACHAVDKKLVGPAYNKIAVGKDPKGNEITIDRLVTSIMKGSSGKWGPIPMPPNPVSADEAKLLAEWIMTLK